MSELSQLECETVAQHILMLKIAKSSNGLNLLINNIAVNKQKDISNIMDF